MWVTTARFAHCPRCTKKFSTILHGRLYPVLDQKQAEDQAGFRKSYQTTDHLATYRLIEQKCHEWGIKMWTSTVDFTKAFDSISHKSIWEALKSCNIDHEYISLLRKIYRDQKASICTDRRREQHFRHPERIKARWSAVQLAVQRSPSILSEGRNSTMAKETRNWYIPERPRSWLPHKLEICRRRDAVRNFQRTDTENDVWIQESNWEHGTQNSPRQDEDSQQPEHHQLGHKKSTFKSMAWASKYWQETKAWNIWVRESRCTNKKRQKSRAGSGRHGRLSTNTDKSWHQKIICWNIVYGSSTPQSLRLFAAQRELGHQTKNTREWSNRRNARCYDS